MRHHHAAQTGYHEHGGQRLVLEIKRESVHRFPNSPATLSTICRGACWGLVEDSIWVEMTNMTAPGLVRSTQRAVADMWQVWPAATAEHRA